MADRRDFEMIAEIEEERLLEDEGEGIKDNCLFFNNGICEAEDKGLLCFDRQDCLEKIFEE